MTTKMLIVGYTRPVASIFKLKSNKGVALGTQEVFWSCGNGNCVFVVFKIHFLYAFNTVKAKDLVTLAMVKVCL